MQTLKESLKQKKLFLLDMDGTLYLDNDVFDGTTEFLNEVKNRQGKYLYLTNNSSKSVDKYVEKMNNLHIPACKEEFFTSTDATIVFLKNNYKGHKIYALGTESFKEQLKDAGFPITDTLEEDIDCLLMGFDTELTFKKLDDASILLTKGVDYYATNPDLVCPTAYGYVPDCGSVSQMLFNATKRTPHFIGKPQPDMALLAIQKAGVDLSEVVLIGDRIYTDIACGNNAGITTILVYSGETTREDCAKSDIKPTYTAQNIREIYELLKD